MKKLEYTFKTDTLFKMLFVEHQDLLKKLVAVLMGIPVTSITQFDVQNPEIQPENLGDKFCRLDINMIVNGQRVDLEIQVCNEGDYIERVMFYWAKEFSSALPSGADYSELPRTMILSILDFTLFTDCKEYHSFFQPLEVTRHTVMSDKMGFHFFELPKLPEKISGKDELLLWLALFNAETEEELEQIKALEVPEMEQAINAYYKITASPEFREAERMREKARHDEAQALHHAKMEQKHEIARNALGMGMTIADIARLTGLSKREIEELRWMEQAITAYYKVTASPEFREVERMWEKARHDEAQALHHAKMEERADAALRMLASGKLSLEEVANFSDLPVEEVKKLQEKRLS